MYRCIAMSKDLHTILVLYKSCERLHVRRLLMQCKVLQLQGHGKSCWFVTFELQVQLQGCEHMLLHSSACPVLTSQRCKSGKCCLASSAETVGSRNAQPFLPMLSWLQMSHLQHACIWLIMMTKGDTVKQLVHTPWAALAAQRQHGCV